MARTSRETPNRTFIAIPSWDDARMFLPKEPRLASAALKRARRTVTHRDRIMTVGASLALKLGFGRVLGESGGLAPDRPSIEDVLAELVGQPVVPAVFLGPPRANRKPVLQVMDRAGELLGVAKLGTSDLSDRLVRAEAENLARVATFGLTRIIHPVVMGVRDWQGHPLVLQTPLRIWEQGSGDDPRARFQALAEIARAAGSRVEAWNTTGHRAELTQRIESIADRDVRTMVREVLDRGIAADLEVEMGSWHGDLSAWNMAVTGDRAMVWDWERYREGVPVGFDALHHDFTPLLKRKDRERPDSAIALRSGAAHTLAGFGMDDATAAQVALLYLVEIASRYAVDGQARTGVAGGDVRAWLAPMVALLKEEEKHG